MSRMKPGETLVEVRVVVALVILVFFALGYVFGRMFL